MCLNAVLRNRLHNNTWSTFVRTTQGESTTGQTIEFLNSFYFSAFNFYFTRVLGPHPNTGQRDLNFCTSPWNNLYIDATFKKK